MNGESLDALVRKAKTRGGNATQAAAISALGSVRSPKATSALVWVLQNTTNSRIKKLAIESLGQLSDPKAVPNLMDVVRDDKNYWAHDVRDAAIRAVGKAGAAGLQALAELFESTMASRAFCRIRQTIAGVLTAEGWRPSTVEQQAVLSVVEKDWDALVQYGEAAVPYVVRSYGDYTLGDKEKADALAGVSRIGKVAVDKLIDFLADDQYEARRIATKALGSIGEPRAAAPLCDSMKGRAASETVDALVKLGRGAVPALVEHLAHATASVRSGAAEALGKIQDLGACGPLMAQLADEEKEVRYRCAEALGVLGDRKATENLVAVVEKDGEREVREIAVWALGEIDNPKCTKFLTKMLSNRSLRDCAAEALRNKVLRKQWAPENVDEEVKYYIGARLWDELLNRGKCVSGHLLTWLEDSEEEIRHHVALCLAKLGYEEGFLALQKQAEEGSATAAEALGELGDRKVIPFLLGLAERCAGLFERSENDMRRRDPFSERVWMARTDITLAFAVAGALAGFRDSMAIGLLVVLLEKHLDYHVRRHAARRLGGLWSDPLAITALERVSSEDVDAGVRSEAKEALAKLAQA